MSLLQALILIVGVALSCGLGWLQYRWLKDAGDKRLERNSLPEAEPPDNA